MQSAMSRRLSNLSFFFGFGCRVRNWQHIKSFVELVGGKNIVSACPCFLNTIPKFILIEIGITIIKLFYFLLLWIDVDTSNHACIRAEFNKWIKLLSRILYIVINLHHS